MLIRRAEPADYPTIRRLQAAAFAKPELAGAEPVEAPLVDALRADGDVVDALSLVAVRDGVIVGHAVCSRGRLDGGAPVVGLGPIGVLPEHQRGGVGTALMHASIGAADALGEPMIVLLGDPAYYGRFGFVLASDLGIAPTDPSWLPYLQVRTLAAYRPELRGTFHYAPAFDGL